MNSRSWRWVAVAASTAVIAVTLLASIGRGPDIDEAYYTPIVDAFLGPWTVRTFQDYNGYPATPGQLFFLVYAGWAGMFGSSLDVLRACSATIAVGVCVIIPTVLQRLRGTPDWADALIALAVPYFLLTSHLLMTEPLTLLLVFASMLTFITAEVRPDRRTALTVGAALLVTAASYVRVQVVVIAFVFLVVMARSRDTNAIRYVAMASPLVLRAAGLWWWGGLTNPATQALEGVKPGFGLFPSHLSYVLSWTGLLSAPILLSRLNVSRSDLAIGSGAAVFHLVFPPVMEWPRNLGLVESGFRAAGVPPALGALLLVPATILGAVALTRLATLTLAPDEAVVGTPVVMRRAREAIFGSAIAMAAVMPVSYYLFDRYLIYYIAMIICLVTAFGSRVPRIAMLSLLAGVNLFHALT